MAHLDQDVLRRLCAARALLRGTGERTPTVEEVAHAVAISPFHFIRRFREAFGETPSRYRTRARIERARALLARGASVTETCFAVGFESLGSFSALFHRTTGTSPSAYRRQARAVGAAARAPDVPGCLGLLGALPPDAFRRIREA